MPGDFSTVPIVDFSRLTDPTSRDEELSRLRDAIFVVGFLYLINTGLEDSIHRTHKELPSLFNLPAEVKERCNMINSPSFLGYTRLGAETTAAKTDLREQFDFGTPACENGRRMNLSGKGWRAPTRYSLALSLQAPSSKTTQYPDYPGAEKLVRNYIESIDSLAQKFVHLVAESLSLPPDTFDEFKGSMSRLKFVKYPPAKALSQGVGPHKDSAGLFTFLSQDNIGGLQAPTAKTRYSIPFFLSVRLDLTLEKLQASASHIKARLPVPNTEKRRDVDVPSEFLSPLYSCFGEAHLRNRIISHPDVGKKWYPDLYEKYSQQRL
ncbi:Oxidoreductase 2OG-Fe(II) oxygenase family [Penicillium chermesinum]|nr:Oxidoreductase 2OG-Fe(II) oxygenase family [Penicillium chermesinum]